jgi:hypothetical protein
LQNDKIRPAKSLTKQVPDAQPRRFSTFDDLARWAVEIGRAGSIQEIRETRRDLWGDLVFEWYTQGQVACIFAVRLAKASDKTTWVTAVVSGAFDADAVTALVDAAAEDGAEVIQLLFPGAGDAAQAGLIVRELSLHPRWLCADVGVLDGEAGCLSRQVGLRWISPDRDYESWALGIADFEPMPFTRRFKGAPFVGLVLRPTPPVDGRAPPVTGEAGLPASHLAHLDDGLGEDQETRDKWTHNTRIGKRALLSPEPLSRARAKVTFTFQPEDFESVMVGARLNPKAPR